jgi:hypothetical protein
LRSFYAEWLEESLHCPTESVIEVKRGRSPTQYALDIPAGPW